MFFVFYLKFTMTTKVHPGHQNPIKLSKCSRFRKVVKMQNFWGKALRVLWAPVITVHCGNKKPSTAAGIEFSSFQTRFIGCVLS